MFTLDPLLLLGISLAVPASLTTSFSQPGALREREEGEKTNEVIWLIYFEQQVFCFITYYA